MEGHRILLIDDDADDQLFFLDAISSIDKTVRCDIANNGIEAINHLNKMPPPPTLIFLDLNMPKMNGYECLEKIKNLSNFKEIPVVIFTTSSNPKEAEKSRSLGAKTFITKTSDFKKLQMRLNEILNDVLLEPVPSPKN